MLKFSIEDQIISREDNTYVVAKSRHFLHAHFDFKTDEWDGVKTALFIRDGIKEPADIDGDGNCEVPWKWLVTDEDVMGYVTVFCGDLLTADKAEVKIHASGYVEPDETEELTPDQYTMIMKLFNSLGLSVKDGQLSIVINKLRHGDTVPMSSGGGGGHDAKEVEFRIDNGYFQWHRVGEEWHNLFELSILKGKDGESATIKQEPIENGTKVIITDKEGSDDFEILNGKSGDKGKSAFESAQEAGYTKAESQFNTDLAKVSEKVTGTAITNIIPLPYDEWLQKYNNDELSPATVYLAVGGTA